MPANGLLSSQKRRALTNRTGKKSTLFQNQTSSQKFEILEKCTSLYEDFYLMMLTHVMNIILSKKKLIKI
jgi:hypothetical protein